MTRTVPPIKYLAPACGANSSNTVRFSPRNDRANASLSRRVGYGNGVKMLNKSVQQSERVQLGVKRVQAREASPSPT